MTPEPPVYDPDWYADELLQAERYESEERSTLRFAAALAAGAVAAVAAVAWWLA